MSQDEVLARLDGLPETRLAVVCHGFWIWMLVDCVKFETSEGNTRAIWSIVIAVTHVIGALIYFFFRKVPRASSS